MQKTYINALYELMLRDERVCSLLSDSGTEYGLFLARDFPDRVFNFGIAEQNKVGASAGMAALGKIPFVYTTGACLAYRAYEFIRDDICMQNRNVKLVGMGAGLLGSTLGATHHTTEDLAALRSLPRLTLLNAATPLQLAQMVQAAYEIKGPVYIRIGMSGETELYPAEYRLSAAGVDTLQVGTPYVLFGTGALMGEIMRAAQRLESEGISAQVVNVFRMKPLDSEAILRACEGKKAIVTIEEHNILGGLGSAIAEVLSGHGIGIPLYRIGLKDTFASGYGKASEVRAQNHLDADGIYRQIKEQIEKR